MTYADKLRDPRWQKKRLEIMGRDNFSCRYCGSQSSHLNVHHLAYEKGREPWDYSNGWLITTCESCHKNATLADKALRIVLGKVTPETLWDFLVSLDKLIKKEGGMRLNEIILRLTMMLKDEAYFDDWVEDSHRRQLEKVSTLEPSQNKC